MKPIIITITSLWASATLCSASSASSSSSSLPSLDTFQTLPATPHSKATRDITAPSSSLSSTLLDRVPPCAIPCIHQFAIIKNCDYGQPCSCLNLTLQNKLVDCLSAPCGVAEGIRTINITQVACTSPPRDRTASFQNASIALCSITGVIVIARLAFRFYFSAFRRFGADDWLIVSAIVVGLPCTILNTVGLAGNGLGKDAWTLSPQALDAFARYSYAEQILYVYLVTTYKLSLLFFYLHLFTNSTVVRVLLWLTVAGTAIFGIISMFVAAFQCTPVSFFWRRFTQPYVHGVCIDAHVLGYVHGAVSVVIDVWMICIPLWEIRNLRLHWKKKVGAVIMFLTGSFVTIVSGLRFQSLSVFANSINQPWDEWPVAMWSTLEINFGLMCACLPTLRLILLRFCPRIFTNVTRSTADRSRSSNPTALATFSTYKTHKSQVSGGAASGHRRASTMSRELKTAGADSGVPFEASHHLWEIESLTQISDDMEDSPMEESDRLDDGPDDHADERPDERPDERSDERPDDRPDERPDDRPDDLPNDRADDRPDDRSNDRADDHPEK